MPLPEASAHIRPKIFGQSNLLFEHWPDQIWKFSETRQASASTAIAGQVSGSKLAVSQNFVIWSCNCSKISVDENLHTVLGGLGSWTQELEAILSSASNSALVEPKNQLFDFSK